MKKIGEIKGIPVVEGNINEVNKNQIHYKENNGNIQLSKRGNDNKLNSVTSSSSGGSSSKYAPRYFSIDWNKCSEEWSKMFDITNDTYSALQFFASAKIKYGEITTITAYGLFGESFNAVKAFSYIPCYTTDLSDLGIHYTGILTIEQCIEIINVILPLNDLPEITLEGITEITEEEYYKID